MPQPEPDEERFRMHFSDDDNPQVALCGERVTLKKLTDYALDVDCFSCKEAIDNNQLQSLSTIRMESKDTVSVLSSVRKWISQNTEQVIDQILETEDGLLLLHHKASRT